MSFTKPPAFLNEIAMPANLLFLSALLFTTSPPQYDLVIRNGTVVDGSGAPGVRPEVAVQDGRITKIGDLSAAKAHG